MRKLILAAGIVAIIAASLLAWRLLSRSEDVAVQVVPRQDYAAADVEFFLQNDPQWANDTLGDTPYRMGGSGCLVSCFAASLNAQGFDADPGRLNALFSDNGVYNSEGEVLWNKIDDAVPGARVDLPHRVDPDRLEEAVAQGLFPIVKVKFKGNGYQHWVMIIGSDNGNYLCMDPLNADKEPLPLTAHGGVIYRYRIISLE